RGGQISLGDARFLPEVSHLLADPEYIRNLFIFKMNLLADYLEIIRLRAVERGPALEFVYDKAVIIGIGCAYGKYYLGYLHDAGDEFPGVSLTLQHPVGERVQIVQFRTRERKEIK